MKRTLRILEVKDCGTYAHVKTDGGQFQIYLVDDNTIRFRCTFDDAFGPEHSYALVKTAWEDDLDDILDEERTHVQPIAPRPRECADDWRLQTDNLEVRLTKDPFGIEIYDDDGTLLYEDLKERSFMMDDLGRRWHYSVIDDHDHFYGFGEKTGSLNKRLRNMKMHQIDACGHDAVLSDPLYKHIPFYIRFNDATGKAAGIFYNNSFDSTFDMGREWSGYWDHYSYYCTDGGDLDMFFVNGPRIRDVVERYTDLTGKSVLPPLPSIGYAHTTMFYTELQHDVDKSILKFFDICEKNEIPIDEFQLASGYTCMPNGKRYAFCWNNDKFKDPAKFISDVEKRGVLLVPNVKPGLLTSHPHFAEYQNGGAFISDETGRNPEIERYWGGFAAFPDFTSENGRAIWKKHMKEALLDNGIAAIWDDNCEFDIQNGNAIVAGDGIPQKISGMKPAMTNMMAYTSYHAQLEVRPGKRPFVVSRAGGAGIQRYAQTWAGDNFTSWDTLKYNIPTILGMGLSGVANQGCDIGGWYGARPEPELLVRWFQNGIFQPRFATNSSNTDNSVTEPCMYPSYTPYISRAIKLRYSFTPYLYALLRIASLKGDPVMRPLVYEFPYDPHCWDESFEFMFGPYILVANVLEKGIKEKEVYLPAGCDWFEWATGAFYQGGQTISIPVTLDSIPMFLRAGSFIPTAPKLINIHKQIISELRMIIVHTQEFSSFTTYEDDGISNDYKGGAYVETTYAMQTAGGTVTISVCREGSYSSLISDIELDLVADTVEPFLIEINGIALEKYSDLDDWRSADEGWISDLENKTARIKYKAPRDDYQIRVNYDIIDLVKM